MGRYIAYARYVLRHQRLVRKVCLRNGMWWRGLKHDASKWRPSEFFPYARHFYNADGSKKENKRDDTGHYSPTDTGNPEFDVAWFLHQKRNDHHWQWWCRPEDESGAVAMEMSSRAAVEMVCDWWGASVAQGGDGAIAVWYEANRHNMPLHANTVHHLGEVIPSVAARMAE